MLHARQNILLADPRRIGKTYWMQTFAQLPEVTDRFRVVWIDYQGVNSTEEFLNKTAEALAKYRRLPEKFLTRLAALFDGVEASGKIGVVELKKSFLKAHETSVTIMESLLTELDEDIAAEPKIIPLVIEMDEVPDAVLEIAKRSKDEAGNLLRRLQHLRKTAKHIQWIMAGSIGFHHVLAKTGATTSVVSDLEDLPFGPLSPDDARELATRLALGIKRPAITPEALAAVVEQTSAFPSLIQKLFAMMQYDSHGTSTAKLPIEAEEVAQRLEDFIEDRDQSRDVTHYLTRIPTYYGKDTALAFRILDFMGRQVDPVSFTDLEAAMAAKRGFDRGRFVATYDNLRDDHYLIEHHTSAGPEVDWRYQVIKVIYTRRQKLA